VDASLNPDPLIQSQVCHRRGRECVWADGRGGDGPAAHPAAPHV